VSASLIDGAGAQPDGLPTPRRYFAVAAIWLAMAVTVLDGAIANIALPTIARDLHTSAGASIWVVNAYQLAIVACLLPLAALSERLGYRRVYLCGVAVFTLGSLACALSTTLGALTAARVLQGLGAAGIMSINTALVRFTYPTRLLGRGIGMNAVVIAIAAAAGPTIAAAILAVADWRWLFVVNLPIGALAICVGALALPAGKGADRPFDAVAALLNVVTFSLLILGVETAARGQAAIGGAEIAVAVAAGAALLRRELHRPFPLLPIDLLRIPLFRLSIATSLVAFSAQMLALVALPFHLQTVLGRDVVMVGLLMTPWPIALALMAPLAGRLADRLPVGRLAGGGLGLFAVGLLLVSLLGKDSGDLDIAWRMAVCGAGFGLFQSPNNRAIVGASPRHRSGAAGGMLAMARVLGQTTGAVGMAVLFHLASSPTRTAMVTAAAIALLAMGVSLTRPATPSG
jgi:DHA2 family multidrug resistance protein-like MFS transporter